MEVSLYISVAYKRDTLVVVGRSLPLSDDKACNELFNDLYNALPSTE